MRVIKNSIKILNDERLCDKIDKIVAIGIRIKPKELFLII